MVKSALITIVAPAYNHELYIEDALSTVANQSYQNKELIVIDDVSTDSTSEIIERVISKDSFKASFPGGITFIKHEKNMDAPYSLNEGARLAKGDYIAFINTDDKYDKNRLEVMMKALEDNSSEFAFSTAKTIDGNGNEFDYLYFDEVLGLIDKYPRINIALLESNVVLSTGNILMTKSLFEKAGGYDARYHYIHDWNFSQKCALLTEPVFVKDTAYNYRLHGLNTIQKKNRDMEQRIQCDKECLDSNRAYLKRIMTGNYENKLIPSIETWEYIMEYKVPESIKVTWNNIKNGR